MEAFHGVEKCFQILNISAVDVINNILANHRKLKVIFHSDIICAVEEAFNMS